MKEDDMDEMLRKAAENYDVDAGAAADWNTVSAAVHNTEPATGAKERKKRRFAFWWLLLISLGWLANTAYNKFFKEDKQPENIINYSKQNTKAADTTSLKITENNAIKNVEHNEQSVHEQAHSIQTKNLNKSNNAVIKSKANIIADNYSFTQLNNAKQEQNLPLTQSSNQTIQQPSSRLINDVNNNSSKPVQNNNAVSSDTVNHEVSNVISASINNNFPDSNFKPVIDKNAVKKSTASINKKTKNNNHYFYAGLMAGGDLSFVKYQKMQSLGYNAGLLAGYTFNKLSIETGLFFDKKNYYTNGEYFDKSKIPGFSSADLHYANGYCKMFEIPLNIHYSFHAVKKHAWFAGVGLSSYLMSKEYYHYAYKLNGEEFTGSYPYYHTTKNWFSVLNISAGYQLQTGAKTNLRIEPYYKAALNGVGTGNLHITSAGLNIGIIKRIP